MRKTRVARSAASHVLNIIMTKRKYPTPGQEVRHTLPIIKRKALIHTTVLLLINKLQHCFKMLYYLTSMYNLL